MENLEKLYDAFGELIYVVAMADGIIKKEEYETLDKILKGHPWAKEIKWSFDYEMTHDNTIDALYNKVLTICHEFGPRKEYNYLIEILEAVAHSDNVVNEAEQKVINKFTKDLTDWFQRDLDKHELMDE
jgi:uncharacterized tellurite resistance protein B-like protein